MGTLDFKPLNGMFNACVHTMAKMVWPQGFDTGPDAPSTYEDLCAEYERRGRITVWDGACDDTIYSCPQTNMMFRAWHDWCHIHGGHDFSLEGETKAAEMQCAQVRHRYGDGEQADEFCKIIMAEVVGQARYEERHGEFPSDQRAFIAKWLSAGPDAALSARL